MDKLKQQKQAKEQALLWPIPLQEILTFARHHATGPLWLEQRGCRDLVRVTLARNYIRHGDDWVISALGIIHSWKEYHKTWRLWPKKPVKKTREGFGWPR